MNQHEKPDEPDRSKVIEVKVVGTAAVGLVCSILLAVLDAVQQSPHVLDGVPEWLRFIILAAIPPTLMFLTGWAIPSNRVPPSAE